MYAVPGINTYSIAQGEPLLYSVQGRYRQCEYPTSSFTCRQVAVQLIAAVPRGQRSRRTPFTAINRKGTPPVRQLLSPASILLSTLPFPPPVMLKTEAIHAQKYRHFNISQDVSSRISNPQGIEETAVVDKSPRLERRSHCWIFESWERRSQWLCA